MPSSGLSDTTDQYGRERCKAAAWAWYERGAVSTGSLCRQGSASTALMVRGKYMRSARAAGSSHENTESGSVQLKGSKKCLPSSRFKREAEALVQEPRHVQVAADDEVVCSSELISHTTSTSSFPPPSACSVDDPCPSDALLQEDRRWSDKLLGISTRKSNCSLQYIDQELDSLILFLGQGDPVGLSSQRSSLFDSFELQELLRKLGSNEGEKSEAKRAIHDHIAEAVPEPKGKGAHDHNAAEAQESHNREPEEGLWPETTPRNPAESVSEKENTSSNFAECLSGCLNPVITSSESTRRSPMNITSASPASARHTNCKLPMEENVAESILGTPMVENVADSILGRPVFYCYNAPPATPPHIKQTLHDLLQWSPPSPPTTPDCHCSGADHFYCSESPDINDIMTGCNSTSSRCENVKARQHRRRLRPSLLIPHFTHSFSNALHHIPHLPHSFSHALHHLPHSLSNALHHLPNSLSNAFHQIAHFTHSLSSAYKNHVASDGQDVEASPSHDANVHAHSHHKPFHLRHLFSFKGHHSPPHPEIAVGSTSPNIAEYRSSPSAPATLVHDLPPKSPSRVERRLSGSNNYMLIYSSTKKKFSKGMVHHHHHHHYHHHYIL